MTIRHPKRLGALALVAAFALGACSGSGASDRARPPGAQPPTRRPASAPGRPDRHRHHRRLEHRLPDHRGRRRGVPGRQHRRPGPDVACSGTGGGFKKFCTGETDINDASRPIKADDEGEGLACTANGIEYVELQVAIDGLTVVVNPANDVRDLPDRRRAGQDLRSRLARRSSRGATCAPASRPRPSTGSCRAPTPGTFDYFTEEINGEVDVGHPVRRPSPRTTTSW